MTRIRFWLFSQILDESLEVGFNGFFVFLPDFLDQSAVENVLARFLNEGQHDFVDTDEILHALGKSTERAFEPLDQQTAHKLVQVTLLLISEFLFQVPCSTMAFVGKRLVNCSTESPIFPKILVNDPVVEVGLLGRKLVKKFLGIRYLRKIRDFLTINWVLL